jgi:hypothetical protein
MTLSDAVALQRLSLTVEDAEIFACTFAAPVQLSRADVAKMGPDAILAAKEAGQLDTLLKGEGQ